MEDFRGAFSRLSRYEKVSAVVLVFFAIAAVFLGIAQTRARILDGGRTRKQPIQVGASAPAVDPTKEDTDKDGLTDYDEIMKYKSSPYLADSDSDGLSDAQEVAAGENPNCPKDQVCIGVGAAAGVDAFAQENTDAASSAGVETDSSTASPPATATSPSMQAPFDPKTVRETLKGAGVSEDVLTRVDDATLKKLYEDTLREQEAPQAAVAASPSQAEYLVQIRKILVDSGVPQAAVDQMSEKELQELIDMASKQLEKSP